MNDTALETRLRDELDAAAGRVDPGDGGASLFEIRRTARRRRLRRQILGVAAGVTALVAGAGLMVALQDDGTDSVQTDDSVTTVATETTQPDVVAVPVTEPPTPTPTTITTTTTTTTRLDATGQLVVSARVLDATPTAVSGAPVSEFYGGTHLMPWDDGFLLVETVYEQSAPPPLSEEMIARFPTEVADLFPDGLPPTIGEASQVLADAGLLDVVTELLNSDPELSAAVLGGPTTTRVEAQFSVDGDNWSLVDLDLPPEIGSPDQLAAIGDRLIVTSSTVDEAGSTVTGFVIASTTDLSEWTVQRLPVGTSTVLPEHFSTGAGRNELAFNEQGWIQVVDTFVEVDIESALPDLFDANHDGFGWETTESGVVASIYDAAGDVLESVDLGWSELGVDPAHVDLVRSLLDRPGRVTWSASWDGEPAVVDPPTDGYEIHATTDGFLTQEDADGELWFSPDGVNWSAIDRPTDVQRIIGTMLLDAGPTAVIGSDESSRMRIHLVDDLGEQWRAVVVENGSPGAWSRYGPSVGGAWVVNAAAPPEVASTVVVEHDGMRLTRTVTGTSITFELVDIGSGAVLASEELDFADATDPANPFESLRSDADGSVTITSPDGEVLVEIPGDVVLSAEAASMEAASAGDEWQPDLLLVATGDGESWVFDDLVDGDPMSSEWVPTLAAQNGDTILVVGPDGWSRYDLGAA